jgi:phosphate transport system substrate-binding protein
MGITRQCLRQVVTIGSVLVVALASSGCKKADPIRIDGSSTVGPITIAAADWYKSGTGPAHDERHADANISVNISGTTGGFLKFCAGETDISDASRPINAEETSACKQKGIEFVELSVAYDGISIVVNRKNNWATTITTAELKTLWERAAEHKVTRWSQVRTGWPEREVHLYGPGGKSGTYDYFNEVILHDKKCRADYVGSEDDDELVKGVASDEGGLGYFGRAYYQKNKDKLALVPVDAGGGPVAPNPDTIRNGIYEPLARPLFIYVARKSFERRDVSAFVDFYLTHAADLASTTNYVPLSPQLYALMQSRAEDRTLGSVFSKIPKVEVKFGDLQRTETGK